MILVTGATGYLGSHVIYELVKADKSVKAVYRNEKRIDQVKRIFSFYEADWVPLFNKISWHKGDVDNYHFLTEVLSGVTHVFHTAGLVSFSDKDKKKLNLINTVGTANVVNACMESGIDKLCHVSSIATLGELAPNEMIDENVVWNQGSDASAYAISKFKGEMEVWRGIYEGLNAVIINPSVIIGPGMWEGPGKDIFYSMQKGLKYYPSGSTGYIDVRDVAKAMIQLTFSDHAGERYIINGENLSHLAFLSMLAKAMNRPVPTIEATHLLSKTAVILESIRALFLGTKARINSRSMAIASEKLKYSNEKIRNTLDITFIPIENSLQTAVDLFLIKEIKVQQK
jgi:nucleoside-diphosphate-sugar epimerase